MLREFIISNDYKNIKSITSTRRFWLTNAEKYRKLTKLAEILLHINSSSTCIERYFSICGFCSKKKKGNLIYILQITYLSYVFNFDRLYRYFIIGVIV